jgi:oxygen-independent coproporphyrinogen-3 oxidase
MTAGSANPIAGLYVHVPFCARKCEYCAFYSEAAQGSLIERYVGALARELELVAHRFSDAPSSPSRPVPPATRSRPEPRPKPNASKSSPAPANPETDRKADAPPNSQGQGPAGAAPRTVFFGGGTPSLLSLAQWSTVFRTMERLHLLGAPEWTIESNPATVSLDKARLWREHGVNRVSMGVQSLDAALLDRLGRVHSREMVFRSFDTLRQAGFDNINIDLMFAIPGQSLDTWQRTLDEATALGSEHLSAYEVIYEEDTPLFEQLKAGEFDVDEELACAMYDELLDRARAAGYVQYEVANFARDNGKPAGGAGRADAPVNVPARACRHNLNYWQGGSYLGLGPSAAGYADGIRSRNWANTTLYCEQLEKGRRAIEWREELPPLRRAGETAAFGLRTTVGWDFHRFADLTGFDLREEWRAEMADLTGRGWAEKDPHGFRLNRAGLRFADAAAEMFLR